MLFEGKWLHAKTEIDGLIGRYFPSGPKPRELHCTELRRRSGAFSKLAPQQSQNMLDDLCGLATAMLDVELRMFTIIYDKAWWMAKNPGRNGNDLYVDAFENLVSRVDLFLRRRHADGRPSKAACIVDPHSTDLSMALKRALVSFQSVGTRWANVYNVIESVMFLHSHESPGLQFADLCSYAVWRLVEYRRPEMASKIAQCFDREPTNSAVNPGKWHGVKYFGSDPAVSAAIRAIWP